MKLVEIRKILKNKANKKSKESTLKFVPTVKKTIWGKNSSIERNCKTD
jgi:hypothetical protein